MNEGWTNRFECWKKFLDQITDFISGIANIIGKLVTGWFSDLSWVNSLAVKNIYICLSGVSIILLPICDSYWIFIIVASMYGFFTSFVILRTIVLVDLLGLDKLTSSFGLLALFEGTGDFYSKTFYFIRRVL